MEIANVRVNLSSERTLRTHLTHLYDSMAEDIGAFLRRRDRGLHLVADGWTAPNSDSVLGLLAVYEERGQVQRHLLSFIQVTRRHTGAVLAEEVFKCTERFGISKLIRAMVLDNAANCGTLVQEYKLLNKDFWGETMRVRCFAHIIQLVVSALYSPFTMTINRSARKDKSSVSSSMPANASRNRATMADNLDSVEQNGLNAEEEEREESLEEEIQLSRDCLAQDGQTDMAAENFRDMSTRQVLQEALDVMANDYGIQLSAREQHAARIIIPTIADFAQLVSGRHAARKDQEVWQRAVARTKVSRDETTATELVRKNETRWNSTHDCLQSHVKFRSAVDYFLSDSSVSTATTDKFSLDSAQYDIVQQLVTIGGYFRDLSIAMQEGRPRMWKVIELFESMEAKLDEVFTTGQGGRSSNVEARWKKSIKIGVKAAQIVSGQYYSKCADDALPAFGAVCTYNLTSARVLARKVDHSQTFTPSIICASSSNLAARGQISTLTISWQS